MDQQPEKSGQPVELPITTSIKGQSSTCHEDHPCYLEHLLLKKDFNHLANLLHATIWQRFYLLPDEHMQVDISSENCVAQVKKSEQAISLTETECNLLWGKENSTSMFSTHLSDTLSETDQSIHAAHSVGLTHQLDRSYLHTDNSINVCNLVSSSIILSPWFVMSAVFAGCPKLLHYLLSTCVENMSHAYSKNKQMSDDTDKEKVHEVVRVGQCLEEASTISPSAGVTTLPCNKNSKYLQPSHSNLDPTIPTVVNCREKPSSYPQTVHQLVNRKMACEFPITDTWIHQSVNLMVSALHLACWRHDFCSISLLLQHGADPNELAMEQVPDELIQTNYSTEIQTSFFRFSENLYFYYDRGFSPLHFIALGLRSPPRHSVLEGCKAGIIHDNSAVFQELKRSESSGFNNKSWPGSKLINHLIDYNNIACILLKPGLGQYGLEGKLEMEAKRELVVNCLEVLLQAGANPNVGESVILKGAYPLDIILQPPTKVYYAPSAARGNQSSISLRLLDLEYCADLVVAACDTLLCHDAGLSLKFLSNYMWRPELLDCFHLNNVHNSRQLVVFLIRLGVFTDRFFADRRPDVEPGLCSVSVYTSVIIHRFIADVINTSVPVFLTFLILNWCSVTLLHEIVKTVAKISEMSGWNDNLKQLSDMAFSLQLRSLKHNCFNVILSRVSYSFSAIWSLPLPTRLKMELTQLYL